jgi:hypothetical protein
MLYNKFVYMSSLQNFLNFPIKYITFPSRAQNFPHFIINLNFEYLNQEMVLLMDKPVRGLVKARSSNHIYSVVSQKKRSDQRRN